MSVIDFASDMIARGYAVFPLAPDSKKPRIQWASGNLPAVEDWPEDTTSYGIDCGKSGLVVIDIDGEAGCNGFDELLDKYSIAAWPDTFTVRTQSGGYHLYFTATGYRNSASKIASHVDIRGDGGYVVGLGSVVNGRDYTIETDSEALTLPWWLAFALKPEDDSYYSRTLDELIAEVESAEHGTRNDTLNRVAFVAYMNDRIDEDEATEALHNAALSAGLTDHEARQTLRSALGASQREQAKRVPGGTSQVLTVPQRVSERPTGPGLAVRPRADLVRSTDTWGPADLGAWFSTETPRTVPAIGKRDDGVSLLYPGRTHSIVAETESGKSWLSLFWCAQEIKQGRNVLYIDFEDDVDGIVGRLTDIADEDEIIQHFTYVRPWGPVPEDIARWYPDKSLIILDGIGEALAMHVLKDDADGFLTLDHHLMRPLSATGAAVVSLDHVPKSKENQDGAIGTVYKINAITGASYLLRNVQPFGLGQSGYSRLFVRKDRPGWIRKECIDGGNRELAAELHIISNDPEIATAVKLKTPASIEKANDYSVKELISNYTFDQLPDTVSKNEICRNVKGDRNRVLTAIDELVSEGCLDNLGTANRPRIKHVRHWRAPF
jgi:hypothetical protein